MKIEKMKEIAGKRTIGEFRTWHFESDWETPIIQTNDGGSLCKMSHYGKMRDDAEFIAMAANNIDKLIKVAEAAKAYKDYDGRKEYLELADALDELERE